MRLLRKKPPEETLPGDKRTDDQALASAVNTNLAGVATALAGQSSTNTAKAAAPKTYVPTVLEIQTIIAETTGYKASERRAGLLRAYLEKKGTSVYELMNSDVIQLGQLLGNHIAVGWTGNVHTGDYVTLTATGPGSEHFQGFIQNVDVFRHYTQLADIDFKNPTEPLLAAAGPEAADVENLAEYSYV
jgi:hypothetical protein